MTHALARQAGSIIALVDPALPTGQAILTGAAKPLTDRHAPIPAFRLALTWLLTRRIRSKPVLCW